mgnify:CR=1 FL=1
MKNVTYYPDNYEFDCGKHFVGKVKDCKTNISVEDTDTLGAARKFENACCLNFASHKRPGGGYKSVIDIPAPIKTQEEDLFRRSANLIELMDNQEVRKFYPLKNTDALYTSDILINKDQRLNKVESFYINLITVPAVVNPQPEHEELVKRKVKRILDIAAYQEQRDLILGAWGCGIFNNDPQTIANLFKNYLQNEFSGYFCNVVFAIPGGRNLEIFKESLV